MGSRPRKMLKIAFISPIWSIPAGLNSNINLQITLAATKEIAMGRKIMALAAAS